jgi:DNA-binding Xre family transcriptional regulator
MPAKFRLHDVLASRKEPMSLRQLAIRSGVSYTTVHAIYHNVTKQVLLRTLGLLAGALDVEPSELIGGTADRRSRRS